MSLDKIVENLKEKLIKLPLDIRTHGDHVSFIYTRCILNIYPERIDIIHPNDIDEPLDMEYVKPNSIEYLNIVLSDMK